jgi:hypothetical protein
MLMGQFFYHLHEYYIFCWIWERLTVINMKSTIFWDVIPCSVVEVPWHLRGTNCLHFLGQTASQPARSTQQAQSLLLVWITFWAWKWRQYVPPQHQCASTSLHSVTSRKKFPICMGIYKTHHINWQNGNTTSIKSTK